MRRRRVNFESLEERQLLNAAPTDAPTAEAQNAATSGLVRYIRNGNLIVNSNSSQPTTESAPQHFPSEQIRSEWEPEFAGDFNGDGLTDIIGQVADEAWLQVNDGDQFYLLPWGSGLPIDAEIVGSGDVNGDGLADIVSFDDTTNEVWVSINSLDHGFQNQLWARWSTPIDTDVFVADFDQDGLTDVLAGERNGSWLLGRSTGTRFSDQSWGRFVDYNWQDMVIGDFDGDSFSDIAARAPDRTWWIWLGTKTGLERATYAGHWKMGAEWYDVQVADFNADGKDDIIGRTDEGKLYVGTSDPTDDEQPSLRTWRWTKGWIFSADWRNVTIVDITGDGLPDQIGQAKDGTWWLAENIGENFRNSFFDRHRHVDFVADLSYAQSEATTSVLEHVPSTTEQPKVNSQSAIASQIHQPLEVSLNAKHELVLSGSGQQLRAIEFQSASGSLIPIQGIGPDFGFNQLASNEAVKVRLSTSSLVTIDGELILGVKWDPSSTEQDLVVTYDVSNLPAVVDTSLGSPSLASAGSNLEQYAAIFAESIVWPPVAEEPDQGEPTVKASSVDTDTETTAPSEPVEAEEPDPEQTAPEQSASEQTTPEEQADASPTPITEEETEEIAPEPTNEPESHGSEPNSNDDETIEAETDEVDDDDIEPTDQTDVELDEPVAAPAETETESSESQSPETETEGEEATSTNGPDSSTLSISLSEDNLFQIDATGTQVYALRIESPTHSLVTGDSPAPFDEILVSDSALVVYAAEEPVAFEQLTQLDLGWQREKTTEQLIVEFANSRTDWLPAELFGERTSVSKTTELPTTETVEPTELSVTLNEDNNFVVTADQNLLGINFVSSVGGLIPGTSPKPFEIFVSNTAKQVTLGTWGTFVAISGSVTLDVGWDAELDPTTDLRVEFGDEVGTVLEATFLEPTATSSRSPRS